MSFAGIPIIMVPEMPPNAALMFDVNSRTAIALPTAGIRIPVCIDRGGLVSHCELMILDGADPEIFEMEMRTDRRTNWRSEILAEPWPAPILYPDTGPSAYSMYQEMRILMDRAMGFPPIEESRPPVPPAEDRLQIRPGSEARPLDRMIRRDRGHAMDPKERQQYKIRNQLGAKGYPPDKIEKYIRALRLDD